MPDATEHSTIPPSDPAVWVERHGDALYRFALLRLGEPDAAEEVVQECLVAALAARANFAGGSSERTWLIGILKRKLVDSVRRQRRAESADTLDVLPAPADDFDERGFWRHVPTRWGGDPRNLLEHKEFWEVLRACIRGLGATLAEPFLLRELHDMDGDEVCQVLNIKPTNLWARLHRARLGIRRCLEANWFKTRSDRR